MKSEIIIVYVPHGTGGVRSVTENIATEISRKQYNVSIQNSFLSLLLAVIKYRLDKFSVFGILSLSSGVLSFLFNSSVFIIHGYPVKPFYGPIRTNALINATRIARFGGARLVSVSHLARNIHQRIYGINVDKVIYNGVDSDFLEISLTDVAKEKIVFYIGRLQPSKGIETIIHAFLSSSLPKQGYRLVFAGDGPLRNLVQTYSSECDSIFYLGSVDNQAKRDLYSKSEIFISLYDFEAMGVVFAEALMASCKIVFPVACGASEFIPPYYSHAKCDPYDISSVSEALDRVAQDPIPMLMESDKKKFSYENIASDYLNVLKAK